jgi:RNA polymerase sigma factor (sigma-70 family)
MVSSVPMQGEIRVRCKKSRKILRVAATILSAMTETTPPSPPRPEGPVPRLAGIDWAAALAAHDRWLRIAVLARLGERQAVDEVMQEVALAAVAQRSPLVDPSKVGAWLHRLAVRQSLLHRRRLGRQHKLVDRYTGVRDDSSPAPDPLEWLVLDERRQLVREALARLAPRDAEVLLLKYVEGFSYRELAVRLGVGESAIEARLHRARARLREALAVSAVSEVSE